MAADENKQIVKDVFAEFGRGDTAVLQMEAAALAAGGVNFVSAVVPISGQCWLVSKSASPCRISRERSGPIGLANHPM